MRAGFQQLYKQKPKGTNERRLLKLRRLQHAQDRTGGQVSCAQGCK